MKINSDVVRAATDRAAASGIRPTAPTPRVRAVVGEERAFAVPPPAPAATEPSAPGVAAAERRLDTFDRRRANLSFAGARPTLAEYERILGTNDLVDEFYLERALVAARPVCRITTRNAAGHATGYATGVMVSPSLLLTNWHVLRTKDEASNGVAEFDFALDIAGNPRASYAFDLDPERFYFSDPDLDFALVAVRTASQDGTPLSRFGYHRLNPDPNKIVENEWITIIQHPGGHTRQFAIRENQLIEKQDRFVWYRSDTAPGSSGAPAFNDSFQVVALHHSGRAKQEGGLYVLRDGRRVASLDDVDDSEVVWEANEGIRVSTLCAWLADHLPSGDPLAAELLATLHGDGDVISRALRGAPELRRGAAPLAGAPPDASPEVVQGAAPPAAIAAGGGLEFPFSLRVELVPGGLRAAPRPAPAAAPAPGPVAPARGAVAGIEPGTAFEKAVQPRIERPYTRRKGYEEGFLGLSVPRPEPSDFSVVSTLASGEHYLDYEHFSISMNAERRLALLCASNVHGGRRERHPEPGSYSRKALTGLGPNDREAWVLDPRIPGEHQLPDRFYNTDGGAFDKGHLVRREDVCWGYSRAQIVRANNDTFHVTNCSPQVAAFNQSAQGGAWGELENEILAQVKSDRYSLFAGPVLQPDDWWFEGKDDFGPVRIQIPRAFWKVVVAVREDALEAFAFVLEQDLDGVPLEAEEFRVNDQWRSSMRKLGAVGTLAGVTFPDELHRVDQHERRGGEELARATGIARR